MLFVSGCNFDCPYCHNPGLVNGDSRSSDSLCVNDFFDFLEKRKGFLDGVVISGGEPTIHKDLAHLCEKIKRIGYPLKLDTNGSRPQAIKQLVDEGLVDYIAMDIKTDPFHYAPFIKKDANPQSILSSIKIIMHSTLPYEFRTTCVKPIVGAEAIGVIAKIIKGAMLYALQRFNHTQVLHPEFFKGINYLYNDDELMGLKALADPWVKKCIVR